jgi:hypothetical protein
VSHALASFVPAALVEERERALAKLAVLRMRLGAHRGSGLVRNAQYARRIVEKWIVESPAGG